MSPGRRFRCAAYIAISVIALIATWSQNLSYVPAGPVEGTLAFMRETMVTPASRSITYDILLFGLAACIWMVAEARRLKMRWVSLYIVFGVLIAISVTFPLFLVAREFSLQSPGE